MSIDLQISKTNPSSISGIRQFYNTKKSPAAKRQKIEFMEIVMKKNISPLVNSKLLKDFDVCSKVQPGAEIRV